jgi:hypothetical protein
MNAELPLNLRLLELLRWSEVDQALADELTRIHFHALADRLGRTLAHLRSVDLKGFDDLNKRLQALPDAAFQRLLIAPRTCLYLSYSSAAELPAAFSYLREAVAVEEHSLGGWSCLGDLYLPPSARYGDPLSEGAFTGCRPWRAPTLPGGAPIDYASPFARGSLPEVPGASVGFEDGELNNALARVQRAFIGVEHVPVAAAYFRRFVRALMLRKDPTVPSFRSASSRLTIGLVVFRNPQLEGITIEDVADCLIHEMIHNICDIIELREPFICDPSIARQVRVDSPWTGRSLDLNTYIQACYVWYGLWEFWLAAFDSGGFDERAAIEQFQCSSLGLQRGMVEQLVPLARVLTSGLLEGLTRAQERVQRALKQLGALNAA